MSAPSGREKLLRLFEGGGLVARDELKAALGPSRNPEELMRKTLWTLKSLGVPVERVIFYRVRK